jgi:DNA polymerase III delta prime subunit
MMKKIETIVKNYDHFNDTIKYIIIDNYNNVPDIIQKNIKVFIEKYSGSSRFILITNKLFSIDPSTRSSCFSIKINDPNKYDKFIYFKYLLKKYGVKYNSFLLFKYCEKYSMDHIARLYYNKELRYNNIYEKSIYNIYEIMNSEFNINEIKRISMNIKELNLDVVKLFTIFVKDNPYSQSKNELLIKEIAHYNYIIKKAYRDIISIEALLIKIYHILNYG